MCTYVSLLFIIIPLYILQQLWSDRFFAQHAAVAYYWVLIGLWLIQPSLSYTFSQLIESHAVDTYVMKPSDGLNYQPVKTRII